MVWRARFGNTRTLFAVKSIQTTNAPPQIERECQVAAHVRQTPHPCIVKYFHAHHFPDTQLYTLVMELCGQDLQQVIMEQKIKKRGRYTPPALSTFWIGQIFLGLEHMHLRMSTLFRDLKPKNVVLDSRGCAKLTDFGVGRFGLASPGGWSWNFPPGTAGYVAPEIYLKEAYDWHADLYSLGVLIWILMTGGLESDPNCLPPMAPEPDFEAHHDDYKLLADCLTRAGREPGAYKHEIWGYARKLRPELRDFVLQLVHRWQSSRPDHQAIRQAKLLAPIMLPGHEAPPRDVEDWLKSVAAEFQRFGGEW